MKGGSIIESGTFNELMSTKSDFENLVKIRLRFKIVLLGLRVKY